MAYPRYLPEIKNNKFLFDKYINEVIKPTKKEVIQNKSSRSAKLRFAIRSKNKFVYPINLLQKFNKYLKIEEINA